jgi:hypothetical protein
MTKLSRRALLKLMSKASGSIYAAPLLYGGCTSRSSWHKDASELSALAALSPVDRSLPDGEADAAFFGDNPIKAHSNLWNISAILSSAGGLPKPSEYRPVVIVGGGVSGLASAYTLRDRQPLILEQGERMGGNSKAQSWRGIDYSIGAAYFCVPEAGSPTAKLFDELGLSARYRIIDTDGAVATNQGLLRNFWKGDGLPSTEALQVVRLANYLRGIFNEDKHPYPDPSLKGSAEYSSFITFDNVSLKEHIERVVGPLGATLAAVIEQYCWSSFAASSTEIGAGSGLNFLAAEFGPIGVLPGGNAAIAEALCERLLTLLPDNSLRTNSTVVDVRVTDANVLVTYIDGAGNLKTVETAAVIMACPKFVASKIIADIEPARAAAIREIEYRSYLVANVLLEGDHAVNGYDLYLLGDRCAQGSNPRQESAQRGITDAVNADYAREVHGRSVLSLYRAYPYRGARAELLQSNSYENIRQDMLRQIHQEILPVYGLSPDAIVDLRIARWGHPIPVAMKGLVSRGITEQIRKPFRKRVFFVEQDNLLLPAIETALGEALYWSNQVRTSIVTQSR